MKGAWKTRSRRLVLDCGPFLRVEEHAVELPDGRVIPDWPWVITPDYVNIVPVRDDGRLLFFRQSKYAVAGVGLAPVGGYLAEGEDPLAGAKRELLEEAGCEASRWMPLGQYRVDGNRGSGMAHFFLAGGLRAAEKAASDDLEEQEPLWLTVGETRAALERGEFRSLPWVAIVALALRRIEGGADVAAG